MLWAFDSCPLLWQRIVQVSNGAHFPAVGPGEDILMNRALEMDLRHVAQAFRLLVSLTVAGMARGGGRKGPESLGMQMISYS